MLEGVKIFFDDGKVEMLVEKVDKIEKELYCCVVVGGIFFNNKGVNFLGVYLLIKVLIDKDRKDLMFGFD